MTLWTPHDIKVLLHHFSTMEPWPHGQTDAYHGSLVKLENHGLIECDYDRKVLVAFKGFTPKGSYFITMLLNTPAPVQRFADPRFPAPSEDGDK